MQTYILGRLVVMAEVDASSMSLGSRVAIRELYNENTMLRLAVDDQQKVIDYLLAQMDDAIKAKGHARRGILNNARQSVLIRES